jgi:predicted SprT family Zn-dependent metalloprotease
LFVQLQNEVSRMNTITHPSYQIANQAFIYFNKILFNDQLPPAAITLQHRRPSLYGYFHRHRFRNITGDYAHEIVLNPDTFLDRSMVEILSTLIHEMAHLWQHEFGKPSRNGYHNRQFADKMQALGLITSQTGQPDGKRTGQQMTHYIQVGGRFDIACRRFLQGENKSFSWGSPPESEQRATLKTAQVGAGAVVLQSQTRSKFTCPYCGQNSWAKPSAQLICGICHINMISDLSVVEAPEYPGGIPYSNSTTQ